MKINTKEIFILIIKYIKIGTEFAFCIKGKEHYRFCDLFDVLNHSLNKLKNWLILVNYRFSDK